MTKFNKFEAFFVVCFLKIFLKGTRFKYILALIDFIQRKETRSNKQVTEKNRKQIKVVMDSIDFVLERPRKEPQCLLRSSAGFFMLILRGIPVRFNIGVKIDPFCAHAWLSQKDPISELFEDISSYVVVF